MVIGKEIKATSPSLDSRMDREIEAEVSIREEENVYGFIGHGQ